MIVDFNIGDIVEVSNSKRINECKFKLQNNFGKVTHIDETGICISFYELDQDGNYCFPCSNFDRLHIKIFNNDISQYLISVRGSEINKEKKNFKFKVGDVITPNNYFNGNARPYKDKACVVGYNDDFIVVVWNNTTSQMNGGYYQTNFNLYSDFIYKIYSHSKKEFFSLNFTSYKDAENYLNDNIHSFSNDTKISIVRIEAVFKIKFVPQLEKSEENIV